MNAEKITALVPLKIHHIFKLSHHILFTFESTPSVWLIDFENASPQWYIVQPLHRLHSFGLEDHGLNHYLKDGVINHIQVEGDHLSLSIQTKGFGLLQLVISLRKARPRFHLKNEMKTWFTSHQEENEIHVQTVCPINTDIHAFERRFFQLLMEPLQKIITQQLTTKKRKDEHYEKDAQNHQSMTKYQTLVDDLMLRQALDVDYFQKTYGPLLDFEHLTFGECVNICYKKIKKAKQGLITLHEQRQNNHQEIIELETLLQRSHEPSFEQYTFLKEALIAKRLLLQAPQKILQARAESPFQITYKNWKVSFGKNQKQNDYLTFHYAKKNEVFIHLEGYPSHHIILHQTHFEPDAIRFTGELLLHLNQRLEAPIVYAKVGSLKQTKVFGQVIVKDKKTMMVKQSYQYPFDALLKNAIRI